MRHTLFAVSFVAVLGTIGVSGASALPVDATTARQAATATSPLQQVQGDGGANPRHELYHERRIRYAVWNGKALYGVVKCFRELGFLWYACHFYPRNSPEDAEFH